MQRPDLAPVPAPQLALAPRFTATVPTTLHLAKVRPVKVLGVHKKQGSDKLALFPSSGSSFQGDAQLQSNQFSLQRNPAPKEGKPTSISTNSPANSSLSKVKPKTGLSLKSGAGECQGEGVQSAFSSMSARRASQISSLAKATLLKPQSFSQRFLRPEQKNELQPNQTLHIQPQKRQCKGQGIFRPQTQINKLFKSNQRKPIENVPSFGGSPNTYGSKMQFNTRDTTPSSSQDIMQKVNELFVQSQKEFPIEVEQHFKQIAKKGESIKSQSSPSQSDPANLLQSFSQEFFSEIDRDFDYLFNSADRNRLFDPPLPNPKYYSSLIPVTKSQQCRLLTNIKKTEEELAGLNEKIKKLESDCEKEREREFDDALRSISLGSYRHKAKSSQAMSEISQASSVVTFGRANSTNQSSSDYRQVDSHQIESLFGLLAKKQAQLSVGQASGEEKGQKPEEGKKKKRHRRVANDIDRHYVCAACKKQYGSEGSLNQHIKLKHPEQTKMLIQANKQQFHGLKRDKVLVNYNQ